jgi:maltooligosyltrehalose trehalohydrolase
MVFERRLSIGAELCSDGVHFRVYAPKLERVSIVLDREVPLVREPTGHFSGLAPGVRAGARYRIRLDDELHPDPASRYQPEGPHGASEVVDPRAFRWTDLDWRGVDLRGQVIYEMHVGTFTREGTFAAAARELEELRRLGITIVELMPLAEADGAFGWGYDGVDLFAPAHVHGRPDDLRAFVDRAHALGIGVILDVVYNHFGPSGNYLARFAETFTTKKHDNDWGDAIDFESDPHVRAFFVDNAGYWIDEHHLDGLRLDATHCMHDASSRHVLAEIGARVREAARGRKTLVVAENEPALSRMVRPESEGGHGLDMVWVDDFHHAARVAATGRREAFCSPLRGTVQELASAVKRGPLFQGQYDSFHEKRRGEPAWGIDAARFVFYLENHDQVSNRADGERLCELTSPARLRALTTLLLLAPATPMLFQGQEFGSSAPFVFFADHAHSPDLAMRVAHGRRELLALFASQRDAEVVPHAKASFEQCKLDFSDRARNASLYEMHRELLRLRREDPVFAAQRADWIEHAALGDDALALRFAAGTGDDRLLLLSLGADRDLSTFAEPLLAEPARGEWRLLFSSEDRRWGGGGTPPLGVLAGGCAVVLSSASG